MKKEWTVGLLMAGLAVTGCGHTPPEPYQQRLRLVYQHTLVSVDPHSQNDGVTGAVLSAVFDGLVEILPGARVEPVLAESWTTPRADYWRFRIRKGVLFHSGRELTPEDVVFSLERARSPSSKGMSNYLEGIESVRVAEDGWVEIHTRGPFPLLTSRLAMVAIVPVEYEPDSPVGTGPYRWDSSRSDGSILLHRWEQYWGKAPEIDEIQILFTQTSDQTWKLIQQHGVDVVGKTGIDFLMEHPLKDFPGEWTVVRNPASATTMLGLNLNAPPLNDPRVRLAIDLSIDREDLVEESMPPGSGKPASALVPEEVFGASPARAYVHSNLQRARQLMQESGVPEGTELRLSHSGVSAPILKNLKSSLEALGFVIRLEDQPFDVFYQELGQGHLEAYVFGWNFNMGDASDFLESMVHSRKESEVLGQLNGTGFSDPLVDRWIESASREISQKKRLRDLRSVLATLRTERPYLPLFYSVRQALFKKPFWMEVRAGSWLRPTEIRIGGRDE